MVELYCSHINERKLKLIPPLPLNPDETGELCRILIDPPENKAEFFIDLLSNNVGPGVGPSAKIKGEWLYKVAAREIQSSAVSKKKAVFLLGTMLGGYNINPLISLLENDDLASEAANALKQNILIYGAFDKIVSLAKKNKYAEEVLKSWGEGEWFTNKAGLEECLTLKVYKVEGETNTDDLSPAKYAWSRSDIPLHALSFGETRFPDGIKTITSFCREGYQVAFVGDVVGTGSSRKSATNSMLWHIGKDIPYVPNKRNKGIVLGGLIAPIFYNTFRDSGGLPLTCDVSGLHTGDVIQLNTRTGEIRSRKGDVITKFQFKTMSLKDEYKAGGRLVFIIGRTLTGKAREVLGIHSREIFHTPEISPIPSETGYTLAQKIVGKACGIDGILPETTCEPKMTTVGSQDTTGLMTADELKELACLEFQCDLFMQSFCHTAAYPKIADVKMHQNLPPFVVDRKGIALHPGDGIIHAWLNRLLLPDTLGTGGDSHTRFPIGLSFPAGSGLVAFAGALGFMPLDMPESVLVKYKGHFNTGITLRDAVNAIPYFAIKQGLLTVAKEGKKNIFNDRILEIEGLPDLTVEQAFELTDATAERSAAGGTIALSEKSVSDFLKSNIALMKKMIEFGYKDAETLKRRIESCYGWLDNPVLLKRDKTAKYKAVIEIDLCEIKESILACPNDPDDVKSLSDVAGEQIDEVFIGSCMTNIGHFRAAAKVFEGEDYLKTKVWLTPPTKMDLAQLKQEGIYSIFSSVGARTEIPGCSLCMGNQARVEPGAAVYSTSTRNFDNRIGDGARVYLGGAELAAVTALKGRLPSPEDYLSIYKEKIMPEKESIYKYLEFNKMGEFKLE